MKIMMLGATGRTGKMLLQEFLKRGHIIHAVVRDKSKLPGASALVAFEGMPDDSSVLQKAVDGCDAIVSALNISRKSDFPWSALRSPKDLLSATMNKLLNVATEKQCRRIVIISAWGVNETKKDLPAWFRWVIDNSNIKYPYADHGRVEDMLRNSPLDWTVVRPVGLINSKKIKNIIVTQNGQPRPALTISRLQVALFMLDILEHEKYVREMVTVSSK